MPELLSRPPRDQQLLGELAAGLNPAAGPHYIAGASSGRPDGWYWTPAGDTRPRYLGRNVLFAERHLLTLLRDSR